jgi:hypothetical protein
MHGPLDPVNRAFAIESRTSTERLPDLFQCSRFVLGGAKSHFLVVTGHGNTAAVKIVANC